MVRSLVSAAAAWLLFLSVSTSALDLKIKNVKCQSRPVQFAFDYICNGDFLCTFGEIESMEGACEYIYFWSNWMRWVGVGMAKEKEQTRTVYGRLLPPRSPWIDDLTRFSFLFSLVIYYGLMDQYGATADDGLLMDANLNIYLSGYTHTVNLLDKLEMPLCHSKLTSYTGNACPYDGEYGFDTLYNMPDLASNFTGWAASGWSGQIAVDMYLNTTEALVGKCTMDVQTMVSGAYENGAFRTVPSAKTVSFAVIGALLASLALCLCCCCCAKKEHKRRQEQRKRSSVAAATVADQEPTSDYHRLNKIKKDQTYLV